MPRKRYSTEQIVTKLRQAEVELGRGLRTPQVCKNLGVSEQTYYWRTISVEASGLRRLMVMSDRFVFTSIRN